MEVDMNVYLVEDCLEDVEKIKGWIELVNGQLGNPNSALSCWCKCEKEGFKEGFNIKEFKFCYIEGTGKRINHYQYYRAEDVSNILSVLRENKEDKLLLLDIKLIEGQRDNGPAKIASEILNEIHRQSDLNVKVLVVTYVSIIHDQLDELLTCDQLPKFISKAMLFPTFYTQQNLRGFVFFSQMERFPGSKEMQL
jgi:hypothetical protein